MCTFVTLIILRPTPGSLAPFWNRAIVLNMRNIVDEDGPDKDGPGNHFSKKRTKPSPMGKRNPVTVGVYKDQLYAFNNGAAKESGNLSVSATFSFYYCLLTLYRYNTCMYAYIHNLGPCMACSLLYNL